MACKVFDKYLPKLAVDYDESQDYPEYLTQESNLDQELNVMSYDPAGGPNGEEVIVLNNFDPTVTWTTLRILNKTYAHHHIY